MICVETVLYQVRSRTHCLGMFNAKKVFLRAMDYFQGILFLTTNRVGHFDEAFRSRIHLSLGYKTLDDKARAQIWDNLFQKLTEDYLKGAGPKIEFGMSAKEYVKLARVMALQWNGREIRNGRKNTTTVHNVHLTNSSSLPDCGRIGSV